MSFNSRVEVKKRSETDEKSNEFQFDQNDQSNLGNYQSNTTRDLIDREFQKDVNEEIRSATKVKSTLKLNPLNSGNESNAQDTLSSDSETPRKETRVSYEEKYGVAEILDEISLQDRTVSQTLKKVRENSFIFIPQSQKICLNLCSHINSFLQVSLSLQRLAWSFVILFTTDRKGLQVAYYQSTYWFIGKLIQELNPPESVAKNFYVSVHEGISSLASLVHKNLQINLKSLKKFQKLVSPLQREFSRHRSIVGVRLEDSKFSPFFTYPREGHKKTIELVPIRKKVIVRDLTGSYNSITIDKISYSKKYYLMLSVIKELKSNLGKSGEAVEKDSNMLKSSEKLFTTYVKRLKRSLKWMRRIEKFRGNVCSLELKEALNLVDSQLKEAQIVYQEMIGHDREALISLDSIVRLCVEWIPPWIKSLGHLDGTVKSLKQDKSLKIYKFLNRRGWEEKIDQFFKERNFEDIFNEFEKLYEEDLKLRLDIPETDLEFLFVKDDEELSSDLYLKCRLDQTECEDEIESESVDIQKQLPK